MYREWLDPRNTTAWLVQVFYGTSEDQFGRPRAVPRMITFRLPAEVESPAEEVHSVPLEGSERLHDLTDGELGVLLDRGKALSRGLERGKP
jgi:hypothetical protein